MPVMTMKGMYFLSIAFKRRQNHMSANTSVTASTAKEPFDHGRS